MYVWVIDQVWSQDGWILAKFFFCVFMDRDEVEVHKFAKKERGQYPAILTEQTWSIKDLLYGFWCNFACGIQQSERAIWFILPARGASHIIRQGISQVVGIHRVSWKKKNTDLDNIPPYWMNWSPYQFSILSYLLAVTELTKADRTVGVNCYIFSNISSDKAWLLHSLKNFRPCLTKYWKICNI